MSGSVARIALATLLLGASWPAMAQAGGWKIGQVSGNVSIQRGGARIAATRGAALGDGDAIITGANGRAVLIHEKDFVTVAANSRVRTPVAQTGSTMTRFFQDLGTAIFRIEKRGVPHFSVDTPYLAAVVKGTTFSVTVGAADTSLQVTEGLVEVATTDGGARSFVHPGAIAVISATDRYRLTVSGDQSQVLDSPLRSSADNTAPAAGGTASAPDNAIINSSPTPVATRDISENEPPATEMADRSAAVVTVAVVSKPTDMEKATGGLVVGESPVVLASLIASDVPFAKGSIASDSPPGSGPAATPIGQEAADVVFSGGIGKNDSEGKIDKTGQDDVTGKGESPGKDKPGRDDKPGKDAKPGQDEVPGKGDAPGKDKPGRDDKPGKDAKPGQDEVPGEGDAPGKDDKPGQDDMPGKGDAPGKDDKPGGGDKPGKDDKPGQDDVPGKGDAPGKDKPGSDDKPGKNDKPGQDDVPGKGDAPGKDKPGGGDNPGKDDKPGKESRPDGKDRGMLRAGDKGRD